MKTEQEIRDKEAKLKAEQEKWEKTVGTLEEVPGTKMLIRMFTMKRSALLWVLGEREQF